MSVRTLASTAAVEGLDVDNLLQQDNPDLAYDAAKSLFSFLTLSSFLSEVKKNLMIYVHCEYVDVLEFGIVDPLKVVRTAVSRATR